MFVDNSSTWRAQNIALLNQIRLKHILDGVTFFANGRRQAINTHRSAIEFFDHRQQQPSVHIIKADIINIEHTQCGIGDILMDHTIGFNLGIITHPPQQAVGDPWRATRTACNFSRTLFINRHL